MIDGHDLENGMVIDDLPRIPSEQEHIDNYVRDNGWSIPHFHEFLDDCEWFHKNEDNMAKIKSNNSEAAITRRDVTANNVHAGLMSSLLNLGDVADEWFTYLEQCAKDEYAGKVE